MRDTSALSFNMSRLCLPWCCIKCFFLHSSSPIPLLFEYMSESGRLPRLRWQRSCLCMHHGLDWSPCIATNGGATRTSHSGSIIGIEACCVALGFTATVSFEYSIKKPHSHMEISMWFLSAATQALVARYSVEEARCTIKCSGARKRARVSSSR